MVSPTCLPHHGSLTCTNNDPANTLYFGCRSAAKDHHYGSEWQAYAEKQQLRYRVAFSRDGPEGEKRTYVQDLIRQDSEEVWRLVGYHKGWVLISGYLSFLVVLFLVLDKLCS